MLSGYYWLLWRHIFDHITLCLALNWRLMLTCSPKCLKAWILNLLMYSSSIFEYGRSTFAVDGKHIFGLSCFNVTRISGSHPSSRGCFQILTSIEYGTCSFMRGPFYCSELECRSCNSFVVSSSKIFNHLNLFFLY